MSLRDPYLMGILVLTSTYYWHVRNLSLFSSRIPDKPTAPEVGALKHGNDALARPTSVTDTQKIKSILT
jgi:hypothetical protein